MDPKKPNREKQPKPAGFGFGLSSVMFVLLAIWVGAYFLASGNQTELKYGQFRKYVSEGKIKSAKLSKNEITGELVEPEVDPKSKRAFTQFRTPRIGVEQDDELIRLLDSKAVDYSADEEQQLTRQFLALAAFFVILGVAAYIFVIRRLSGPGSAITFGRSRARLYAQDDLNISFEDVAGIDEAVEELKEVVDFLKTPEKYQALGGRIPKGVLLVGPPGTGKTLLAKAVAGEASVPFFSLSGSDFVEMFVGVGAARVRDLFAQAEQRAPCIIFIDELDALGKSRGAGMVGSHEEREQTLNQLLVEMDGFDSNRGVIIMAATNRPETLDAALLRPGRFDRTVVVDRPDVLGREAILKVHCRNVKVADDIDLRATAGLTPGFAGADLANLVNEAALLAARQGNTRVARQHFEEAIERGVAGLERKQRVMLPEEKKRIAYHECGHAIVAYLLPGSDPVHKISIIPRGVGALGYTLQRPLDDRYLATQSELNNRICTLLGGITAEELIFPDVSTGAQNDLKRVTQIARGMVTEYGMSPKLGRINYADQDRGDFLAGSLGLSNREHSENTANLIDQEVKRIVDQSSQMAREILTAHRAELEKLAELLLEKESLDAQALQAVMDAGSPRIVPGTVPFGQHPSTTPIITTESVAKQKSESAG